MTTMENLSPSPAVNKTTLDPDPYRAYLDAFQGRRDIVPKFWSSKKTGQSGYSPICRNDGVNGVCSKPCRTCSNADYVPLSDQLLFDHFQGRCILGLYPLMPDGTAHLIAADFDDHDG